VPAISATAPGKAILFGEHAVVYGQPAIAVPVRQVQARAVVLAEPRSTPGQVRIQAPNIGLDAWLDKLPPDHPLVAAIRLVLSHLGVRHPPAFTLRISSTIPVASGLGSSAAVSVAAIRAVAAFLGRTLSNQAVSDLAFQVEKIHHGTPSGIDNTVIAFGMPVYYTRDPQAIEPAAIEILRLARSFTLVIADSGISSPTASTVGEVRQAWQADPPRYEDLFNAIGELSRSARQIIMGGQPRDLGPLMVHNHYLLRELGVSCAELDNLVEQALSAGAIGAKLSGGGRGGNMLALVTPPSAEQIARSLQGAGAVRTLITEVMAD